MTFVYQPSNSATILELDATYWVRQIQVELNKIWHDVPNVELHADTEGPDRFGNRSMFIYARDRWTREPISLSHIGNATRKEAKWVSMNFDRGTPDAKWEAECIKRELQHHVKAQKVAKEETN